MQFKTQQFSSSQSHWSCSLLVQIIRCRFLVHERQIFWVRTKLRHLAEEANWWMIYIFYICIHSFSDNNISLDEIIHLLVEQSRVNIFWKFLQCLSFPKDTLEIFWLRSTDLKVLPSNSSEQSWPPIRLTREVKGKMWASIETIQ